MVQRINFNKLFLFTFQTGDRNYPTFNLSLRHIAVSVLSMYNQRALYKDEIYDSKFVYFLALEVLGKERLVRDDIQQNRFDFAERLFKIRLEGQPLASERIEKYRSLLINRINELKIRSSQMAKQNADLARIQTEK